MTHHTGMWNFENVFLNCKPNPTSNFALHLYLNSIEDSRLLSFISANQFKGFKNFYISLRPFTCSPSQSLLYSKPLTYFGRLPAAPIQIRRSPTSHSAPFARKSPPQISKISRTPSKFHRVRELAHVSRVSWRRSSNPSSAEVGNELSGARSPSQQEDEELAHSPTFAAGPPPPGTDPRTPIYTFMKIFTAERFIFGG